MTSLENLNNISSGLSKFILNRLEVCSLTNARTFYAESFALYFLAHSCQLNRMVRSNLVEKLQSKDRESLNYHFEFNNYALIRYLQINEDKDVEQMIKPLRFNHTATSNWTLLRSITRLLVDKRSTIAIDEAKQIINKFQLQTGFILDSSNDWSFQYHCFSASMLAEIYEETKDEFFLDRFLKAVYFIRNFILSNGDTLYIGRGQNQVFGYGCLIYMLSCAIKFTGSSSFLTDIGKIAGMLTFYQNEDGSFPLVLSCEKYLTDIDVDLKNPDFFGWYSYNNYFDYLAFFASFISKSLEILNNFKCEDVSINSISSYSDQMFVKVVRKDYEAVISKCGGIFTNDLAMPYIVYCGNSITPCYGGEQFVKSLYSLKSLPMPFSNIFNISFRKWFKSFFVGTKLIFLSIFGVMIRDFSFNQENIRIRNRMFSLFGFRQQYLFKDTIKQVNDFTLEDKLFSVNCNKKLRFDSYQYSAVGRLKLFVSKGILGDTLIISFKKQELKI